MTRPPHIVTAREISDLELLRAQHPARMVADATDALMRQHFQDTPLALQSITRTGVVPWPIRIEQRQVTEPTPGMYRIVHRIVVVEDARPSAPLPTKPMAPCTMEPVLP